MSGQQTPQQRKPRRVGRVVIVLVIVVLIALVLVHLLRGKKTERGAAPQVVTVAAATLGPMPELLSALGTVTPTATVTVLPQLSGYLTAVVYREGQDVQKGQFLAQIDPRQYEISKQQAEAQLAKDRALLAQARADLARYTQLNEHKSIAEQTYVDQQYLVETGNCQQLAVGRIVDGSDHRRTRIRRRMLHVELRGGKVGRIVFGPLGNPAGEQGNIAGRERRQ